VTTRDLQHWQDTDFGAIGAGRSRVSARAARRRANTLRLIRFGLGSGALITLLTLAAIEHEGGTTPPAPARLDLRVEAPTLRTPPALWQPRETRDIALAATPEALAGNAVHHRAERHSRGGARDTFSFGAFHAPEPYLHLVVTRDSPGTAARSFYVATALHAAEEGLAIHRIQAEEGLNSSRLALITAGITLEDGSRRSCIAFRGKTGAGPVVVSGWYCAATPRARDLACLIDGLDVIVPDTRGSLFPARPERESACIRDAEALAPATPMPDSRPPARDIAGLLAALEAETDERHLPDRAGTADTVPLLAPPERPD